jgi:cell shape-determining protein MreD
MKLIFYIFLALALLTIESVVVKYLGMSVTRIDVTVALVVFLAIRATTLEGALTSFSIGYILDAMSGKPTGLYAFLAVLTFVVSRLAGSLVDSRSSVRFALFVMAADFGHGLVASMLTWLVAKDGNAPMASISGLLGQVLLTGLAALILYPLFQKVDPSRDRQSSSLGLLR